MWVLGSGQCMQVVSRVWLVWTCNSHPFVLKKKPFIPSSKSWPNLSHVLHLHSTARQLVLPFFFLAFCRSRCFDWLLHLWLQKLWKWQSQWCRQDINIRYIQLDGRMVNSRLDVLLLNCKFKLTEAEKTLKRKSCFPPVNLVLLCLPSHLPS